MSTLAQTKGETEEVASVVATPIVIDTSRAVITRQFAAYVTAGKLEVGLRRWTLLDKRIFHQTVRVAGVEGRVEELAEELGYPSALVDNELLDFLYHSSRALCAVGVEYAAFEDDWETIKRKFKAYIATPGIDDLWTEVNKAINHLDANPNPVTAPGVDTQKLDPKPVTPEKRGKKASELSS